MAYSNKTENQNKLTGTRVSVYKGNIEQALSLFKKKVNESGRLILYRSLQEFIKPSEKKRIEKENACRRNKMENN